VPGAGDGLLRVFEISQFGPGEEFKEVVVDLPSAWARKHEVVRVAVEETELFGVHARLVSGDGEVLLSFPWTDNAEQQLLQADGGEFPVAVAPGEKWEDIEEAWWAVVIGSDDVLYVAEAASTFTDAPMPAAPALRERGTACVAGVEISWSCVARTAYEHAWRDAIETLAPYS
jgi:hypothetical protein